MKIIRPLCLVFAMGCSSLAFGSTTRLITTFGGAVANDGGDDASAIQYTIDHSSPGDTVSVPAGTFNVFSTLTMAQGVKLLGVNQATSILLFHPTANVTDFISLPTITGCEIATLTIDANNNPNLAYGVHAFAGGTHNFHNLTVQNFGRILGWGPIGIQLEGDWTLGANAVGTVDSLVTDCTVQNIGLGRTDNSMAGAAIAVQWGSHRAKILRNTMTNLGGEGLLCRDYLDDVVIRDNNVSKSDLWGTTPGVEGFQLGGHGSNRMVVEDNTLDRWLSINADGCQNFAVRRNIIVRNPSTDKTAWAGVEAAGTLTNSIITDNIIDYQDYGISATNPLPSSYNLFSHNSISHSQRNGLYVLTNAAGNTTTSLYFFNNSISSTKAGTGGNGTVVLLDGRNSGVKYLALDTNQFTSNLGDVFYFSNPAPPTVSNINLLSVTGNTITGNTGAAWATTYPGADLEWSGNTVNSNGTNTQPSSSGFTSDPKPAANFTYTVGANRTLNVTNTTTGAARYLWDFNDGTPVTSASPSGHQYQMDDIYRVTLVAWSSTGRGAIKELMVPVSSQLEGWWMLDETTGTSASDATGNSHTGTLVNGPTWSGAAVSLDGVNDYVEVPYHVNLKPAQFTVSLWAKSNSAVLSGLFRSAAGDGWTSGFSLIQNSTGTVTLRWGNGTANDGILTSTSTACTVWRHIVATFDGTTMRLYVDGSLQANDATVVLAYSGTNTQRMGVTNGIANFGGQVDDVRVYSRALSAAEILALHDNLRQ